MDVLRDESEAYAHKLMEAGVIVTAVRYHGTIHDFVMLRVQVGLCCRQGSLTKGSDISR